MRDDIEVMSATGKLARGRAAYEREAWSEAYLQLAAADRQSPIDPEDLDRLAVAAYLIGEDAASNDALTRAHQAFLDRGEILRAARSALWLAFTLLDRPEQRAQAGGWLARVRRLVDESEQECVEHGFWLCASAFLKVGEGDFGGAQNGFVEAASIGAKFKDRDLTALARHGQGRLMLGMNRKSDGLAMLDEVMVGVACGEVGPIISGVVYCSVISACHELFDLRRAQEWTMALANWCAAHPDMVPFRGSCLVRRSELLQFHGSWDDAMTEVSRARDRLLAAPREPDIGTAHYQWAELHRLRGEFEQAEDGYRRAAQAGRKPHPGLALLRLAQGDAAAAELAIRHVLQETRGFPSRIHVLRAAVEILIECGDLPAARAAAEEIARVAGEAGAPFLQSACAHALGAVALADGDLNTAIESLRDAAALWQSLDAPFEVAKVRMLVGMAYDRLRDHDGAEMEFDAAQETFERLGAVPDATRIASLRTQAIPAKTGGLTGRELEVLRLVAGGKSNRAIASDLAISEKTVARHLSNIFTKLDLPSRSAATAYAYEHKLL